MATVQNVQQNGGTNYTIPAAVGGAVAGGLAGGLIPKMPLVPAKYKSAQELVDAMSAKDKFEINLPDNASDEVKNIKEGFKDWVDQITKDKKEINEVFGDKSVLTFEEIAAKSDAGEMLKMSYDGYQGIKKLSTINIGDPISADDFKLIAPFLGEEISVDNTASIIMNKELKEKMAEASKRLTGDNSPMAKAVKEFCESVEKNDGKIAKNDFEKYIIKLAEPDDLDAGFKKLSDYLPKSKIKGAAIWAAIGAVALGIAGYFMSSKKNAA